MPNHDKSDELRRDRKEKRSERELRERQHEEKREDHRNEKDPEKKAVLETEIRQLRDEIEALVKEDLDLGKKIIVALREEDPGAAVHEDLYEILHFLEQMPAEVHLIIFDSLEAPDLAFLFSESEWMKASVELYLEKLDLREVDGPNAGNRPKENVSAAVKLGKWLNGQYQKASESNIWLEVRKVFNAASSEQLREIFMNALQRAGFKDVSPSSSAIPLDEQEAYLKEASPQEYRYAKECLAAGQLVNYEFEDLQADHDIFDVFVGLAGGYYYRLPGVTEA